MPWQTLSREFSMNRTSVLIASFAVLAAILPSAVITFAVAQQRRDIEIGHPWARATPGSAPNGAAYFSIVNKGDSPDRLIATSSPAAERAEVHESKMENGVMTMRPLGALTIEPGKAIEFKPNARHVMLMALKHPLKEGETFPLTLTFEKSGDIQITVSVEPVGAMGPGTTGHAAMPQMDMGGDHDHMKMKN
jgi:copper(I)-binding protein